MKGDGILHLCPEDRQQHLDLCPAQGPRYTCVNVQNQQRGKKNERGLSIHILCPIPFPLRHQWPRLQRSRMQQLEAVLHHWCWKLLSVSLHKSRESITLKSNSEQETILNCLYFTSGCFQFSCPIWNNVPVNALKSFWKGKCVYQAS